MKTSIKLFLLPLLTGLVICSCLNASEIDYLSPNQMGVQAEKVVCGKVARVESFWNEKHTKIFTRVTITIDETYKGQHQPQIEILQLGGIADNIRYTVHGALYWKENEEVLLFLEPYVDTDYQVTGFSQGKFEVERDPETGRRFVKRAALEGIEFSKTPGQIEPVDKMAGIEKVSLERFVAESLGNN
jgi:hypothetical protein